MSERERMGEISDALLERVKPKYAGDCECGQCQLVPLSLIYAAAGGLTVAINDSLADTATLRAERDRQEQIISEEIANRDAAENMLSAMYSAIFGRAPEWSNAYGYPDAVEDAAILRAEMDELKRKLGGGCDAADEGDHTVMKDGRYAFCAQCGESLTGVRYCHATRAALDKAGR